MEITTPSLKDIDTRNQIRTLYLEGKEVKEILDEMKIPKGTWDNALYMNHNAFRDFYLAIKREYMIQQAEKVSNKILNLENTSDNAKLLAIQQKESEFLRETQGKDLGYSKRIETFGVNVNTTEQLDDDQKEKLNKLLRKTGNKPIKEAVIVETANAQA